MPYGSTKLKIVNNFLTLRVNFIGMPRKYTKKNKEYWENLANGRTQKPVAQPVADTVEPNFAGEPLISFASSIQGGDTLSRSNRVTKGPISDKYSNIAEGILPFDYSNDAVNVTDACELCQKAYFNIPAFRSTIDLLAEFSDTDVYLEGGSKRSRDFFELFFKLIKLPAVKDQFFRELYRGSNVFFLRFDSKLKKQTIKNLKLKPSDALKEIPIKYLLLNPTDIVVDGQLSFGDYRYAKALTPFEIERLKQRKTKEAQELYESLPQNIKEELESDKGNDSNDMFVVQTAKEIRLPLDDEKLHVVFYKKQDYEPLSIPIGFCVLDDLNKKLELKKVDQAIARSVENVILLVTMGNEPDKGGIDGANLAAMQELFANKSVGRVLISDYTTRAEFVIPDLTLIMGEQKYEVLNRDIQEGLGNILIGESKYSDTELKLKLFFQRLEKGKDLFIRDFLQPEIDRLSKLYGFKQVPKARMAKEDVISSEKLQKLVTRMMELGVLTPEQGIDTIHKGEFPAVETMHAAQLEWREQKLEGLYAPLISSQNFFDPITEKELLEQEELDRQQEEGQKKISKEKPEPSGRPSDQGGRGGEPKDQSGGGRKAGTYVDRLGRRKRFPQRKTPTVSAPTGGRPMGQAATLYSVANLIDVCNNISDLNKKGVELFKKKLGKEITDKQKSIITEFCMAIVESREIPEWETTLASLVDDPKGLLKLNTQNIILDIGAEHGIDVHSASLLYHSLPIEEE